MNIGIVGFGKLGAAIGVAIAHKGHRVLANDICPERVMGRHPYNEGGYEGWSFDQLWERAQIQFAHLPERVLDSDLIFVVVQTPHGERFDGTHLLRYDRADFDYGYLRHAVQALDAHCRTLGVRRTVAVMSTVLPGTIRREILPLCENVDLVYNPAFPAMGTAVRDFLTPEFVLIGTPHECSGMDVSAFYRTITLAPQVVVGYETAEAIKVLYNTYITSKITFANAAMELCHKVGANVDDVSDALGLATRRIISPAYMQGGMGDGGACLPPDEIVITGDGPRPIGLVRRDDMVLTRSGELRRVLGTWERDYDGPMVHLRVRGLPPVRMTADHPVFCAKDGRRRTSGTKDTSKTIASCLGEECIVEAGQLDRDCLVPWPIPHGSDYAGGHLTGEAEVSCEYMELAGWYLSEGCAQHSRRRGRLTFTLNVNEMDVARRIGELCLMLDPPTRGRRAMADVSIARRGANGLSVRYGSKALAGRLITEFGSGAQNKYIPAWLLWGDLDDAKLLMRGLWQGDGHTNKSGMSLSTISKNLAWGAYVILLRCGIPSTLRQIPAYVGADGTRHKEAYEVRVRNKRFAKAMSDITGLPDRTTDQAKLYEVYGERDDGLWRPVHEVQSSHYVGKVYNLWVAGDHSFVTACGAVHNCHPRDLIAMSWLARKVKLSFDLFDSLAKAREYQAWWLCDLVLEQCVMHDLTPFIVGTAFKAGSNIEIGSAALLCKRILEIDQEVETWDPHIDGDTGPTDPHVFLVGCNHPELADYPFPAGSVVIDPWRMVRARKGVTIVRVGQ